MVGRNIVIAGMAGGAGHVGIVTVGYGGTYILIPPGIEDFTTYTEVDPNNHLSKTFARVTATDLINWESESAYIYKDKGVGYFSGDFRHYIDIRCISGDFPAENTVWGLLNALGSQFETDDTDKLMVFFYAYTTNPKLYLRERYGGSHNQIAYDAEWDTTYYLIIERKYSTLTCEIYSDSDRTDLLETLSRELHSIDSYRYIFVAQNVGYEFWYPDNVISCWCENLFLRGLWPGMTISITAKDHGEAGVFSQRGAKVTISEREISDRVKER